MPRTPGEWHAFRTGILSGPTWVVSNAPNRNGYIMSADDAAFIETACNSHEVLVAALSALVNRYETVYAGKDMTAAKNALKKAGAL